MREVVPCNGCTLCCRNEALVLHPECGDDIESYETEPYTHPLTGEPVRRLKHKPNGDCIYLGERGCTIHERAPVICQEFDCRRLFLKFSRNERRELIRKGILDKDTMAAGRDRLSSLEQP